MHTIKCSGPYSSIKASAVSSSSTNISLLFLIAFSAICFRESALICNSTSFSTSSMSLREVATKITWLSTPCSAWLNKSDATKLASAESSATTNNSEGPAGISIATPCFVAICFATVTNWLPGPNILYT